MTLFGVDVVLFAVIFGAIWCAVLALVSAGHAHRRVDLLEKASIELMARQIKADHGYGDDDEPPVDGAILDLGVMLNNFGRAALQGFEATQAQIDELRERINETGDGSP